jgi:hypothetical protein
VREGERGREGVASCSNISMVVVVVVMVEVSTHRHMHTYRDCVGAGKGFREDTWLCMYAHPFLSMSMHLVTDTHTHTYTHTHTRTHTLTQSSRASTVVPKG